MGSIKTKDIITRLEGFDVTVSESDMKLVELIANGVENYILNYCNITFIPSELYYTAIDMCCGTYLKTCASLGKLDASGDGSLSSITEGDVTIGFREGSTSGEIMNSVIDELSNKKGELECFKRLRW